MSLRLDWQKGFARTNCRRPTFDGETGTYTVKFDLMAASKIAITPVPDIHLLYVREVQPLADIDVVPCGEFGILGNDAERWTVAALSFENETLRLPYLQAEKEDTCGIEVNQARKIRKKPAPKPNDEVVLSQADLAETWAGQQAKSSLCAMPNFSVSGITISEKNFARGKLTNLKVGWQ